MIRVKIFAVLLGIISLNWMCVRETGPVEKKVPVARVHDEYLYLSDIQQIFPDNVTKEDSLALAQSYINTWVKNQLILNKAELNLTPEQLDIKKQIDAYRSSLLIYKYEDQMVRERLDTIVKETEIEQYYNQNTSNFILDENLVKALYLKIPKSAPNIEDVKLWYKSQDKEYLKKLDSYCYNYASKYDYFDDNWVSFSQLKKELPQKIENDEELIKNNKYIEQEDDGFYYFVYLKENKLVGSLAPFVYVQTRIRDIIINKRKVKFLADLENEIYNDALDNGHFKVFNVEK
jgi:hypothetical protein